MNDTVVKYIKQLNRWWGITKTGRRILVKNVSAMRSLASSFGRSTGGNNPSAPVGPPV